MKTVILEEGNLLRLPAEWAEELGLNGVALLERVNGGILIQSPAQTEVPKEKPKSESKSDAEIQAEWDEVFRHKLCVPPRDLEAEATEDLNNLELRGDDYVFEPPIERGLDTMLIAYSLLEGHPAAATCEQFLRERQGWFATPFILVEAKMLLSKVYGLEPAVITQNLMGVVKHRVQLVTLNTEEMIDALSLADTYQIDLMDATLLQGALVANAKYFATDDAKLAKVCTALSLTVENPIDVELRQEIAVWEDTNLPEKGLPRILRSVHRWLKRTHSETAEEFWSQTGAGSHLP